MMLKSAKPKSWVIYLRSLFLIPAIACLLVFLWCVWSVLPYFLAMAVSGLLFQLSFMGFAPLLNLYLRVKS